LGAGSRYAAAIEMRKQWAALAADKNIPTQAIATSHMLLGRVNLEIGEPAEALKNYAAARAAYQSLPKAVQNDLGVRRVLVEIRDR